MAEQTRRAASRSPGLVEHLLSGLNAWIGDYLSQVDNELQQPMGFFHENQSVAPRDISAPTAGKICVFVHGLGCNESLWNFPASVGGGSFGEQLQRNCGFSPLYLRFNTGLRVSENGQLLAALLEQLCVHHEAAIEELLLIGHSQGGLVIRSACHVGSQSGHAWVSRVRHAVYLGSPHLGAPLERATNVASKVFGLLPTTATRVLSDLLNTRSQGIKDLRFGNLVEEDWFEFDPDELMNNRRVPIPWLATARHHFAVGLPLPGVEAVGDVMVQRDSAAGRALGSQPGPPAGSDVRVMDGLDHLALARNPAVCEAVEQWVTEDE